MNTEVIVITPKEELPTNWVEDKFGFTYYPKTGGEHRVTKDLDGKLRTVQQSDIQGLVFQNDIELEMPELDLIFPSIKLNHHHGWAALFLSYATIMGEILNVKSTNDITDDILLTLVDSVTMGILASEDGDWYILPLYEDVRIAVELNDERMPSALRIKTTWLPDKEVTINL